MNEFKKDKIRDYIKHFRFTSVFVKIYIYNLNRGWYIYKLCPTELTVINAIELIGDIPFIIYITKANEYLYHDIINDDIVLHPCNIIDDGIDNIGLIQVTYFRENVKLNSKELEIVIFKELMDNI